MEAVRRRGGVRWLAVGLSAVTLALLAVAGAGSLTDRRVRLHSLVRMDPPPAPVVVQVRGQALSVSGAVLERLDGDGVALRAWEPTPVVEVLTPTQAAESDQVVRIDNLPTRVRLVASGPVEERRAGLSRTLHFSPGETRRLAFVGPTDDVVFAVLGDTGDSRTLGEALRVAAREGADFFVHAGDLVYVDAQIPHIEAILREAPLPLFAVRGNHDYRNQRRIDFLRRLAPAYYAFRMGGATFVILDNADDYLPFLWGRSTQYRWWTHVVAESRDGPLFVFMHKPPFQRQDLAWHNPLQLRPFTAHLAGEFQRAGVTAVFTGHLHTTDRRVVDGVQYVVNGDGMESPADPGRQQMAFGRVHGSQVTIEQVPVWRR